MLVSVHNSGQQLIVSIEMIEGLLNKTTVARGCSNHPGLGNFKVMGGLSVGLDWTLLMMMSSHIGPVFDVDIIAKVIWAIWR
jgi:hypothetical protein